MCNGEVSVLHGGNTHLFRNEVCVNCVEFRAIIQLGARFTNSVAEFVKVNEASVSLGC